MDIGKSFGNAFRALCGTFSYSVYTDKSGKNFYSDNMWPVQGLPETIAVKEGKFKGSTVNSIYNVGTKGRAEGDINVEGNTTVNIINGKTKINTDEFNDGKDDRLTVNLTGSNTSAEVNNKFNSKENLFIGGNVENGNKLELQTLPNDFSITLKGEESSLVIKEDIGCGKDFWGTSVPRAIIKGTKEGITITPENINSFENTSSRSKTPEGTKYPLYIDKPGGTNSIRNVARQRGFNN